MHFFAFALVWLCALFPIVPIVPEVVVPGIALPRTPHFLDLVISALEAGASPGTSMSHSTCIRACRGLRRLFTILALVAALYVILKAYHVVVFRRDALLDLSDFERKMGAELPWLQQRPRKTCLWRTES